MIEIRNFKKVYGKFVAVYDLNLKIERSEIFGFIGPNGAGKTTTIRFLSTLLKASAGDAWVNGCSVARDPHGVKRQIGFMPDHFGVYDGMRVWEFLDFFGAAFGIDPAPRAKVIDDVLHLLDLAHKRDDPVEALSRGMRQRLCLAKTLIHNPPILILDEPASGLDPRARIEIRELIRELGRMGKTILLSSHILPELATLCTRIGIIETGTLLFQGTVEEAIAKVGTDREVEIAVQGDPATAELALTGIPGVLSVRQARGHLRATLAAGFDIASVPEHLVRQGLRLTLLKEREIDLEDVFLRMTKGAAA